MKWRFEGLNFTYHPAQWLLKSSLSRNSRSVFSCDLSGEISAGDFIQLTGANGVGKTTLVRLLGGILKPSRGVWQSPPHTVCLIAESVFHPELSLFENIRLYAGLHGRDSQLAIEACDKEFDLLERYGFLSQGQRARFALSAALGLRPDLLFLDEQLQHLDSIHTHAMLSLLEMFVRGGGAVVAVSHQPLALSKKKWQLSDTGLTCD